MRAWGWIMPSMFEKQTTPALPEHVSPGKGVGEAVRAMESLWKVTWCALHVYKVTLVALWERTTRGHEQKKGHEQKSNTTAAVQGRSEVDEFLF